MSTGGRKRCSWWPSTSCTRGPGTASAPTRSTRAPSRSTPSTTPIRVIRFEQFLGLFHEQAIQQLFLPYRGVHPVLEHVLRHGPLRRHAGRVRAAVLEATGRVPGVAQQPGDHDRAGDRRLRAVPADAAAAARQAVRPLRRGLHRERRPARGRLRVHRHAVGVRRPVVVRLRRDGQHLQPVRGDAEHAHRLVDVVRRRGVAAAATALATGASCSSIRWRRCSASSSPPTTTGSTASAACSASPSARCRLGPAPLEPAPPRPQVHGRARGRRARRRDDRHDVPQSGQVPLRRSSALRARSIGDPDHRHEVRAEHGPQWVRPL